MAFVLDASIAAYWAFPDENDARADQALTRARAEEIVVPSLWWFEVRNILVVNERRKRITEFGTIRFLRELARLRIRVDYAPEEAAVLRLARSHRLSVYDASYLELALREDTALATLDGGLAAAAAREGTELIGTTQVSRRGRNPKKP